jgi:hypothetical protein
MLSPNANIQTDYLAEGGFPAPGSRWRSSSGSVAELIDTACGDMRVTNLGVYEIEVTAATAAENWQINFDGVLIPFTTVAAVNSTATAIHNALLTVFGPGKALESQVKPGGVTVDADTVTVEFIDGKTHLISLVAPGGAASTFVAGYTADGVPALAVNHKPGLWVCIDGSSFDPQLTRIKEPSATTDIPYGVVVLEGAVTEDFHVLAPDELLGPLWPAGEPLPVARRMQIVSLADGEVLAADVGKPVYCVARGARKGWSSKSSGGTNEIWTGTVVANNADAVGVTIDSLPRVEVVSTASASATATLLANAINARADLSARVTATTNVANIILTFKDFSAHTVVAYSPATADVTPLTATTAAVAATGILTHSTFMTPAADGDGVAINVFEG